MNARGAMPAKVLYGVLFCVAIPAGLAVWAVLLEPRVGLPRVRWGVGGWAMVSAAVLLWVWSVWTMWREGRGCR